MINNSSWSIVLGWLCAGVALGFFNIMTQWWTVQRLHPEAPHYALVLMMGGMMLRWLLAAGLFITALQGGLFPLLMAFAGLWLARWGMLAMASRQSELILDFSSLRPGTERRRSNGTRNEE